MKNPIVVAYGGGLNSTAVLVGMAQRKVVPDAIVFADTGAEKPATYDHVAWMDAWCSRNGFPRIEVVRNERETLEEKCLRNGVLPSLAYGLKSCSLVFKKDPQEKWATAWERGQEAWNFGERCIKVIGFDAGETRRAGIKNDERWIFWYPLIEWDMDREACLALLTAEGVPVPPKSSCFFCPASTKREILDLSIKHADLMARALKLEAHAKDAGNLTTTKGLGRRFAWADFLNSECRQARLFPDPDDVPCMCADGEDA